MSEEKLFTNGQVQAAFQTLERFIALLYLPIIVWTALTVIENREGLRLIQGTRFTNEDGYELVIQFNTAMETVRSSVAALQAQLNLLEARLSDLERER